MTSTLTLFLVIVITSLIIVLIIILLIWILYDLHVLKKRKLQRQNRSSFLKTKTSLLRNRNNPSSSNQLFNSNLSTYCLLQTEQTGKQQQSKFREKTENPPIIKTADKVSCFVQMPGTFVSYLPAKPSPPQSTCTSGFDGSDNSGLMVSQETYENFYESVDSPTTTKWYVNDKTVDKNNHQILLFGNNVVGSNVKTNSDLNTKIGEKRSESSLLDHHQQKYHDAKALAKNNPQLLFSGSMSVGSTESSTSACAPASSKRSTFRQLFRSIVDHRLLPKIVSMNHFNTNTSNLNEPLTNRPILIDQFFSYVSINERDSDLGFMDEFMLLDQISKQYLYPKLKLVPHHMYEKKNRFNNILPFYHSLVKLDPIYVCDFDAVQEYAENLRIQNDHRTTSSIDDLIASDIDTEKEDNEDDEDENEKNYNKSLKKIKTENDTRKSILAIGNDVKLAENIKNHTSNSHFYHSIDGNNGFNDETKQNSIMNNEKSSINASNDNDDQQNDFDEQKIDVKVWSEIGLKAQIDSTYINASFIPGYHHQNEYIATQHPWTQDVMDDFFRMILQYKISIIVNLVEIENPPYIPQWYDQTIIRNVYKNRKILLRLAQKETFSPDFEIKRIQILNCNSNSRNNESDIIEHEFYQFHYKEWRDFDRPTNIESLLRFIKLVRQYADRLEVTKLKTPILVHCRAGVGRTGTFIAIDQLWQRLNWEFLTKFQQDKNEILNTLKEKSRRNLNEFFENENQQNSTKINRNGGFRSFTSCLSSEDQTNTDWLKLKIDIFGLIYQLRGYRTGLVQSEQQYSFIYKVVRKILEEWHLLEPVNQNSLTIIDEMIECSKL